MDCKVYNNSDYFSKPKTEEKMLLVCSNIDQVFYISLLMEEEPKRAFLIKNIILQILYQETPRIQNHYQFKN